MFSRAKGASLRSPTPVAAISMLSQCGRGSRWRNRIPEVHPTPSTLSLRPSEAACAAPAVDVVAERVVSRFAQAVIFLAPGIDAVGMLRLGKLTSTTSIACRADRRSDPSPNNIECQRASDPSAERASSTKLSAPTFGISYRVTGPPAMLAKCGRRG